MFLVRIDRWIVETVERFCHYFQRLTGRTNFFLAGILYIVLAVVVTAPAVKRIFSSRLSKFDDLIINFAEAYPVFYIFYVLSLLIIGLKEKIADENEAFARLAYGLANRKKISWLWIGSRLILYCLTANGIVMDLFAGTLLDMRLFFLRAGRSHLCAGCL